MGGQTHYGHQTAVAVFDLTDEAEAVRIASEQTTLTHNTQVAVVAGLLTKLAFVLKRGELLPTIIEREFSTGDWLAKARGVCDLDPTAALGQLGRDCSMESALPSLLCLLSRQRSYREAVIENVMAGGDSAAWGLLLGALLAAQQGDQTVPPEWRAKVLLSSAEWVVRERRKQVA